MKQVVRIFVLLSFSLCSTLTIMAAEEQAPRRIAGLRVGFAGHYKVGVWTPVVIALTPDAKGSADALDLIVPDGEGVPSRVTVSVDGDEPSVRALVRFGRVDNQLTARLRLGDETIAERTFSSTGVAADYPSALVATRKLILSVGPEPLGVDDALRGLPMPVEQRPECVHLDEVGTLPYVVQGYDGVDALLVSSSQPELFDAQHFQSTQCDAMDTWLRQGGTLVWCVGTQAEQVLASSYPLSRFAPGRFERLIALRRTAALESYAGSSTPLTQGVRRREDRLEAPRLVDVLGVVDAQESKVPLVVRTPRGFGQVTFLATDLDRPPLSTWADRPALVERLLGLAADEHAAENRSDAMHLGYRNMAGQLRSALDHYAGVRTVSFWLVIVLLGAYLLLIGPVDYFVLRRFAKRMQWTWLTFPTVVVVFCVAAYLLADHFKGREVRVTQADLVDMVATDDGSWQLRGTTWFNVFSPATETFTLGLRPRLPDAKPVDNATVSLAWLGLPGGGLGGMDPRAASPTLWSEAYDLAADSGEIRELPIAVWSSRSFTGQWHGRSTQGLETAFASDGETIGLKNTFDFALHDCLLAVDRWVYELGTLEPGEAITVGATSRRADLKTVLTGRKIVFHEDGDKYETESTPYDRTSNDPAYILRAMMFYSAAGGATYTGMSNEYQSFVDLSRQLELNRIIFVGRAEDKPDANGSGTRGSGAVLLRDGQPLLTAEDGHETFYRFVVPRTPNP